MTADRNHTDFFAESNMSSVSESQHLEDIFVVCAWAGMGFYGLSTNMLILVGILHNQKMSRSTSYWLIISLSLCDSSMIIVCLCHLLPATAMRENFLEEIESFRNAFAIFVYDAFWYTGVLHLLIMSVNRYVNICAPKYYLKMFSRQKTLLIIGVTYLAGILVAFPGLFACCYLVFDYTIYVARYSWQNTPYAYVDMVVNGISMTVMIYCYACIVYKVRKSRMMLQRYRRLCRESAMGHQQAKRGRRDSRFVRMLRRAPNLPVVSSREIRLFFQFAAVSSVFLLSFATWQWLPFVANSKWVGFAVTSLFFINNATNPTVYLIFNQGLRHHVQRLMCPFRATGEQHNSWVALENAMAYPGGGTLGPLRRMNTTRNGTNLYAIGAVINANVTAGLIMTAGSRENSQQRPSCTSMLNHADNTSSGKSQCHTPRRDFSTENIGGFILPNFLIDSLVRPGNLSRNNGPCDESQRMLSPLSGSSAVSTPRFELKPISEFGVSCVLEADTESVHL